ncbi:MAG: transcriptional regulator PpsR [Pseudomonadota bacterium]
MRPFRSAKASLGELNADIVSMIVAAAADIALILEHDGTIIDVALGKTDFAIAGFEIWKGKQWADVVAPDSRQKVTDLLADIDQTNVKQNWREINHPIAGGEDIPIQYKVVPLASQKVVALGRDLRSLAVLQQQLVQAQLAMERDYHRFRQSETRYHLLFDRVSEPLLVVEAETLMVVEANKAAHQLFNNRQKSINGTVIKSLFDQDTAKRIADYLKSMVSTSQSPELPVSIDTTGVSFRLRATLFRQDQTPFYLINCSDVQAGGHLIEGGGRGQLPALFQSAPDGIVMTSPKGEILMANPAFLALADIQDEGHAVGRALDDWLGGAGINFRVLTSSLKRDMTVKQLTTQLVSGYGKVLDVEVSAVALDRPDGHVFSFFIRDISRRLSVGSLIGSDIESSAANRLTELVGRVSLKDIVRSTTDIIERLCIESALEMTGDNRASAAEMLGLSRQSLYIKMRRFGVSEMDDTKP